MDNKMIDGSGMGITRGIWYYYFSLSFTQKVTITIPTRFPKSNCQSVYQAIY